MGGERMAAAGLDCIVRSEEMAVMGLTEIVHHLPRIWREFRKLKKSIRARRPSVAILIDFPEIHFRLAKELHRLGVPVLYFVSPQLWAWKKHRIKLVRKYIDRMLVIFPFEEPFYREQGVAGRVCRPSAGGVAAARRQPRALCRRKRPRSSEDLDRTASRKPSPGDSRPSAEILRAAHMLAGDFEFILPLAPTLNEPQRDEVRQLVEMHGGGLSVRLVNDARAALHHARASIVASGTATVEAALAGNPFVVVYRVSALTYAIAKRVVKVPHVAMANLIAGKRIVPELIQSEFTAENIVSEIEPLLSDGPPRHSMMEDLAQIRVLLKTRPPCDPDEARNAGETGGAIARVAEVAQELMKIKSLS